MTILKAENIFASYGKREVLKGVNIHINKGEIVSLIGPNGAGKSTILKTIIGLLIPEKGKIYFNDLEITGLPVYRRTELGIGYLFQGGSIFTNLSVVDNLKISSKYRLTNCEKVFSLFPELKETINMRAGLLSGGLKQMLSLSMQLIKEPELLLLDEPSAGLAPSMVKNLISKIKEINQESGISILLVEQNIKQALSISNRAYLMRNGKIISEELQPKNLLREENFEKVFFEG